MDSAPTSKTASLAGALGLGAVLLAVAGVLLAQIGLPSMVGFNTFLLGLLAGVIALVLGAIGLFITRGGRPGRPRAWMGLAGGLVMIVVVGVGASPGSGLPPINDITTDLDDPPVFAPATAGHRNHGRDMAYPEDFAPLVRAAYPDLHPIHLDVAPAAAYARSLAAAESLGWQIGRRDPAAFTFEAEDASALFHFVDDVVVRVRAADGGSRVDVRSKSRDGRGDLGANANRIRAFAKTLAEPG